MRTAMVDSILGSAGSTEPSDFGELLRGMGDEAPERGDREGWRSFFDSLGMLENLGLVDVDRIGGKVNSVMLTPKGADKARELGLLQ
jgi:hypothetical protein